MPCRPLPLAVHRYKWRSIQPLICLIVLASWLPSASAGERALFLPGQSIADPDGALSLSTNPAGLAEPEGAELRLQGAAGGAQVGETRGTGWGAFLGLPLGPLAMGVAIEHTRDVNANGNIAGWLRLARASLGAAVSVGEHTAIGAVRRWHGGARSAGTQANRPPTWDVGVVTRPWTWLSVAARLTRIGDTLDGQEPMHGGFGVALRPFRTDRLTVAADVDKVHGERGDTVTARLTGRVAQGVHLSAEFSRIRPAFQDDERDDRRGAVTLRFSGGAWGIDASGFVADQSHVSGNGDRNSSLGMAGGLRLSRDVLPQFTDEGDTAVRVRLRGELAERPGEGASFLSLIMALDRIARQPGTRLVVLHGESVALDWAQVEELRTAIARLRAANKRVVWYGDQLGTRTLMVAAACDRIVMAPGGTMAARGIGTDFLGLAETLQRIGITVQTLRFAEHKTAGDALTGSKPSPQLEAQLRHGVERRWATFVDAVALGRAITPSAVEAALDRGAVFPEDARDAGLIDAVVASEEFEDSLHQAGFMTEGTSMRDWNPPSRRRVAWGARPIVSVIGIEGNITDRSDGPSPLGRTLSGVDIAQVIREAGKESAAVVARIHSPGGSIYGSEAMREALARAGEAIPVVASMGGVAASGGYWTSLGAATVFADRATVTGSIGILALKPSFDGLLDKIGLKNTHFGAGPHHDSTSLYRAWTDAEREVLLRTLGRYYGMFLDRTATRRGLDRATLPDLAGGRIWFGDEALQHRLIDRIGGLHDAMALAKAAAGIGDDDEVRVRFLPEPGFLAALQAIVGLQATAGMQAAVPSEWRRALASAVGPWLDAATLADPEAPLALSPITDGGRGR